MAKFKAQVKDVELFIRVKLSGKDQLVHQELDYIANRPLRGFLRPSYRKTLLGQVIEYRGPMGISISERLARPLSKYDFFFIIAVIMRQFFLFHSDCSIRKYFSPKRENRGFFS